MADTGLTGPALDLAARHVIHAYLADLSGQLGGATAARTAIVAELEDGLWAATATHQARGLTPAEAARAAVAEFGDARTVAAGFGAELAAATGRRVGLGLLTTGPLVGTSWLLVVAATWTRTGRQPPAALGLVAALVGLVLMVAVPSAVLSVAVSGRLSRWLPGSSPWARARRGSAWPATPHAAAWPPARRWPDPEQAPPGQGAQDQRDADQAGQDPVGQAGESVPEGRLGLGSWSQRGRLGPLST
jgi:hypothetical protein